MNKLAISCGNEKTFWTDENGQGHPFVPCPGGCEQFLNDRTRRHVALYGGWGSGKTSHGVLKLLMNHIENAFGPDGQPTYIPSAIVEPNYMELKRVAIPKLRQWCLYMGISFTVVDRYTTFVLNDFGTKQHPSVIYLISAASPESWVGWEVGSIMMDESGKYEDCWEDPGIDPIIQLQRPVRAPGAKIKQLLYCGTPDRGPQSRFWRMFHDADIPDDRAYYKASTEDNPSQVETAKQYELAVPSEYHDLFLHGEALDLSGGRVYSAFCHAENVADVELDLSGQIPLLTSWDFGQRNGCVLIGHYWEAKQELHICHEMNAGDVAKTCERLYEWWQQKYRGFKWSALHVFGDRSGLDRPAGGEGSDGCFKIIRKYADEIWQIPRRTRLSGRKNPPVRDRVATVNMSLMDIKGTPHIKINPRCTRLIRDLTEQKWNDDGFVLSKGADSSVGHRADALGYVCFKLRPIRVSQPSSMRGKGRISV